MRHKSTLQTPKTRTPLQLRPLVACPPLQLKGTGWTC